MNRPRQQLHDRRGAFTLIELLVVIGIIGILAALILATAGYAITAMRKARATAERDALVTAIQRYKQDKGSYPPDHPGDTVKNALFYELTGMVATLAPNGAPVSFTSPLTGETFMAADVPTIFGVTGFVNSSADRTQIKNYFDKVSLRARTAVFSTTVPTSPTNTIFGLAMRGPQQMTAGNGALISPFNYVSTNPTNNPDSYDLWIDVTYGGSGKNNRVSNWSKEPQPF